MRTVILQKWDFKAKEWTKNFSEHDMCAKGISKSPLLAPFLLLNECLIQKTQVEAYVFRYLNDYNSFFKTAVRLASEYLVVLICKLFGIKIFWILHNIDKETSEHWPRITEIRRNLVARNSDKGFVMDELLLSDARCYFPKVEWAALSFGVIEKHVEDRSVLDIISDKLVKLRGKLNKQGLPVYIGLCVTGVSDKCDHLFRYKELIERTDLSCMFGLVYVGNFSGEGRRQAERLAQEDNVELIDVKADIDESVLNDKYDFIYRSLSDLSVPYTIYRAAALGKPIITHETGFCARVVNQFSVGLIVDDHMNANLFFKGWSSDRWLPFLARRTWSFAGKQLLRNLS